MKINRYRVLSIGLMILISFVSIYCSFILRNTFWGDPSIYLTYSKNIFNGDWFSFNPGEFSSGSTSPLWAIILSLGFLFPDGILGAKIISSIFTLIALLCMYFSLTTIVRSDIASVFGMFPFIFYVILNGDFLYETPLIVFLICCLLMINWHVLSRNNHKLFPLMGIVWSLIPVSRPEMTLLVIANLILLIYFFRRKWKTIFRLCLLFFLSLIPAILYFGYSYLSTSALSSSSYCRLYSILEMPFSIDDNLRYVIPLMPLMALVLAIAYKWVQSRSRIIPIVLVILISPFCLLRPIIFSHDQASRELTFDVITERNVANYINETAQAGSSILMYEVQDRFYLRNDLFALSLDGITDGKIAPFFQDVSGFLQKYQPVYWVANNSVNYRPFLSQSILHLVIENADELGDQYTVDGIRFTNIWINPDFGQFSSFANASAIYRLEYGQDGN